MPNHCLYWLTYATISQTKTLWVLTGCVAQLEYSQPHGLPESNLSEPLSLKTDEALQLQNNCGHYDNDEETSTNLKAWSTKPILFILLSRR